MPAPSPALLPVILCGGAGTRLWPLSRLSAPKQFLRLLSQHSLFQETVLRVSYLPHALPPLIICNQQHRFLVRDHLSEIGIEPLAILLEPESRNTGAAIAAATAWAALHHPDAVLLVCPSDHTISDERRFAQAVDLVLPHAASGKLLTLGVTPAHPETNYGYINAGVSDQGAMKVEHFVEKPDGKAAQRMQKEGSWYWNSGMFCFTSAAGNKAFAAYAPELCAAQSAVAQSNVTPEGVLLGESFTDLPSIAFDRAVVEKADNVFMVPLNAGWADLGTWKGLWQKKSKRSDGNSCAGEVLVHQSTNCLLYGGKRLLAVAGVRDLVVIDTDDVVLVAHQNHAEQAGLFAATLREQKKPQALRHISEHRPWGYFQCIDNSAHFKVKRLSVLPGAKLSMQLHHHRAEHWVIVSGVARVTRGEDVFELVANQSTYIPVGTVHCLENPGKGPLEIIEVQTGSLCDESDIVRLDEKSGKAHLTHEQS
jgi:mannose-1-phosphate guanylyltransferase / mannose-6-phosphate isomerase